MYLRHFDFRFVERSASPVAITEYKCMIPDSSICPSVYFVVRSGYLQSYP